jgi:tRNA A37 N6-isopentenylltransferase MiaA
MLEALVFALVIGVGVYMIYIHKVKKDKVDTPPTGPLRPIPLDRELEELNKAELVDHLHALDPKAKTAGLKKADLIAKIREH